MNYNYDGSDYYNKNEYVYDEINDSKPPKKKMPFGKVLILVMTFALMFGVGAGGGYYFFSTLGDNNKEAVDSGKTQSGENSLERVEVSTQKNQTTALYDVSDVVKNSISSIVSVTCSQKTTSSNGLNSIFGNRQETEDSYVQSSAGTGIIVDEDAENIYIVTNYHVIQTADKVDVSFVDETTVSVGVKGYDSDADLAVLSLKKSELSSETINSIKAATIGDSNASVTGEGVVAIGNALGYGQSVTTGVISALNREVQLTDTTMNLLQTDAAINPGNSGGALLNSKGELIGINTVKFASQSVEGMGYAIPISEAWPIIQSLVKAEVIPESEQGYMGITGRTVDEEYQVIFNMPEGVYVAKVEEGSPAHKAGILAGSIITKFDGKEVKSMDKLSNLIKKHRAGDVVEVTVYIANQGVYEERTTSVTLVGRPAL